MNNVFKIVLSVFLLIIVILVSIGMKMFWAYLNKRMAVYNNEQELLELRKQQAMYIKEKQRLEYSDQMVEFIKKFIGQIVVIKFRTFKDGRDIAKLTEQQIKNLINEIALEVKEYLIAFRFNDPTIMVFSEKYYNVLIVNTIVMLVKDLTDKSIDDYAENFDQKLFE